MTTELIVYILDLLKKEKEDAERALKSIDDEIEKCDIRRFRDELEERRKAAEETYTFRSRMYYQLLDKKW